MDLLVTGNLATFTSGFCRSLAVRHKVVMSSRDVNSKAVSSAATSFDLSPTDDDFEKLFNSYNFDTAIFCSQHPEIEDAVFNEFDELEHCLKICSDHDVKRVIYIASTSEYTNDKDVASHGSIPTEDLGVMFSACQQLCEFYQARRAMSVIILRVPALFGYGEKSSLIGKAITSIMELATYKFTGSEDQYCDFLSEEDLGELLVRMIDSWPIGYTSIDVPGSTTLTFRQLGDLLKVYFPTARLSYAGKSFHVPSPTESLVPRQEYDWVPMHKLEEELPMLVKKLNRIQRKMNSTLLEKVRSFLTKHDFIIKVIELILAFVVMEFLNYVTATSIQFQYIDFRLLYVVILGSIHGVKVGLAASAFASISLLIAYIMNQSGWDIIIYNVDTWLPFIFYVIVGSTTGYVRDRMRNDNKFLADEKEVLEHKYISLNSFYVSALQNKDQYKNQIMSYRDSFGRMYDITKKLDSTLAETVIQEALGALEGVLENQSICIYSCDENLLFGRLNVCSKKIASITEKSIVLSKLPNMINDFKDGEVWVNRDRLLEYPEYAAPIFRDNRPVAIIILQKVKYEQFARYYENLIKVLCGLVKISLLRALEFTEQIENEMYLPGTRIMVPSYFNRILEVKEKMAVDGISEYTLLRFQVPVDNLRTVAQNISRKLRTTDIMGLSSDQTDTVELYICLSQTNDDNIGFVIDRIQQPGIVFEKMNVGGE